MYDHFRNEIALGLSNTISESELRKVLRIIDKVADNYEVSERETHLAVRRNQEFPEVAKMYLVSKHIEGLSQATLDFAKDRLDMFFRYVDKDVFEIVTNDIRIFLNQYQIDRQVKDVTVEKTREVINGFFQWLVDEEYIEKNPCKKVGKIKCEYKQRQALTQLELEMLRRKCQNPRDLAIVDVLYSTGARVTELINMKLSDVDWADNSIHIIGKGKKHHTVYLNANAQLSLNKWLEVRDSDEDYIFTSFRNPYGKLSSRMVEHVLAQLGEGFTKPISPHIIRHTTATRALQNGMPIDQVQKLLNHSSLLTTQRYAETLQSDVKSAHAKYVI